MNHPPMVLSELKSINNTITMESTIMRLADNLTQATYMMRNK